MFLKTLFSLAFFLSILLNSTAILANNHEISPGGYCYPDKDVCCNDNKTINKPCINDGSYFCAVTDDKKPDGSFFYQCKPSKVGKAFGTISPPPPLGGFLSKDPTGAGGISTFLSNGVNLIYLLATIVFIFMLLWGAFDWLTSGGDKEKIASAQKKIINAVIGIMLFAAAFAIITVLGFFTGFKFFKEQGAQVLLRDSAGNITKLKCPNGRTYDSPPPADPYSVCK